MNDASAAAPQPGGALDLARYRGVRVVVTGASGFIGRWVLRMLCDQGAEVHVAARTPSSMHPINALFNLAPTVHRVDLAVAGQLSELCRELRPAVAFNLAGYGVNPSERDAERCTALNQALPGELARAMLNVGSDAWAGRSLVHAGSALEYGPVPGAVTELVVSAPTTSYGRTKLAGAQAIEAACEHGLRAAVGRIFTAYGPGEHPGRLLPTLLAARHRSGPIPLTEGLQSRDFVYVCDVAEALLRLGLVESAGFDMVNIATGTLSSVRRFVEAAARALDLAEERLNFGALPYRPEEMWHGEVSCAALRSTTGFAARFSLDAGLQHAVKFADRRGAS